MLMDLAKKKALVFGGTSGVGLATVKRLKAAGATVLAISRTPEDTARLEYEGDLEGVRTISCDVTDEAAVEKVCNDEGPFDVLISTATGGPRTMGPFLKMSIDGYKASFAKLWGYARDARVLFFSIVQPHARTAGTSSATAGPTSRPAAPSRGARVLFFLPDRSRRRDAAPAAGPRVRRAGARPQGRPGLAQHGRRVGRAARPLRRARIRRARGPDQLRLAGHDRHAHVLGAHAQGAPRDRDEREPHPAPGPRVRPRLFFFFFFPSSYAVFSYLGADEVAHAIIFAVTNTYATGTTVDVDGGWLAGR